ncbi:3-hydroxybutyrate dehydrogenase type 2-like [Cucurbita pepo subsp. pepo]|uniref:3-hydroxybutyrate dehydrogenase type 2-like n=1 Tax=Cucurbita pepo subsp. pepo TaxID=3664 RepID=UPI000C9DA51E|nr:3-hydroxybutyrate dehydrogenase type 2-like [Cucurbita pepo subsp. pepo]
MKMKESENVSHYITCVQTVANKLNRNGEMLPETQVVEKILRSLTDNFKNVVCAIEESKDLAKFTVDELAGSLETHEQQESKDLAKFTADELASSLETHEQRKKKKEETLDQALQIKASIKDEKELFHDPDDSRVMCVNVKGVELGIKHATPVMIPRATDFIISTTSVASVSEGMCPHTYTTSKHDIVGLTKNTAHELGRYGICVNCILPFGVATTMLVNAWMDDGNECKNFGIQSPVVVDQMEEFVRGLTNIKDSTMRAYAQSGQYHTIGVEICDSK